MTSGDRSLYWSKWSIDLDSLALHNWRTIMGYYLDNNLSFVFADGGATVIGNSRFGSFDFQCCMFIIKSERNTWTLPLVD